MNKSPLVGTEGQPVQLTATDATDGQDEVLSFEIVERGYGRGGVGPREEGERRGVRLSLRITCILERIGQQVNNAGHNPISPGMSSH